MAWFGPAANLAAGTLDSSGTSELAARSAEPFGLSPRSCPRAACGTNGLASQRKLDDEGVQLALCDGDRERCVSPAALQFLAIVDTARAREGRARLGEINRAINLAIRPMSDLAQYGEIDVWSSPLVTFAHGAGDCEDYAIAKFVALAPGRHLARRSADRDHARHHSRRGSRRRRGAARRPLADAGQSPHGDGRGRHVRNYRPLFVIDQYGVMQYADAPLLAGLPDRDAAPPVALKLAVQPGLISPAN